MTTSSPTRTAWITGANGALGSAVTAHFLAQNWRVIAFRRSTDTAPSTTPTSAGAHWITADLAQSSGVKSAVTEALKQAPVVDAVIHCAGGFRYTSLAQASDDDIDFLLNANLKSSIYLGREVAKVMQRQGHGRIIFVGAKAATQPGAGMGLYAATKAGLHALIQSLAADLAESDIRVHGILPGIIDTPTNRTDMPAADYKSWTSTTTIARLIGDLCQYPAIGWSSGSLLPV